MSVGKQIWSAKACSLLALQLLSPVCLRLDTLTQLPYMSWSCLVRTSRHRVNTEIKELSNLQKGG